MNVMTYVAAGVGVVVVLIVIFFVKWIFSLRRVVPTNEVHIVRRGKNTKNSFAETAIMNFRCLFRSWVLR